MQEKYITYSGNGFVRVTRLTDNCLMKLDSEELQHKIVKLECQYNSLLNQIIQRVMQLKQKVFSDIFQLKKALVKLNAEPKTWFYNVPQPEFDQSRLKVFLNGETSQKLQAVLEDLQKLQVSDIMSKSIKTSYYSKISLDSTRPDLSTNNSFNATPRPSQTVLGVGSGSGRPLNQIKILPKSNSCSPIKT